MSFIRLALLEAGWKTGRGRCTLNIGYLTCYRPTKRLHATDRGGPIRRYHRAPGWRFPEPRLLRRPARIPVCFFGEPAIPGGAAAAREHLRGADNTRTGPTDTRASCRSHEWPAAVNFCGDPQSTRASGILLG